MPPAALEPSRRSSGNPAILVFLALFFTFGAVYRMTVSGLDVLNLLTVVFAAIMLAIGLWSLRTT
jgi:hypothetical protein